MNIDNTNTQSIVLKVVLCIFHALELLCNVLWIYFVREITSKVFMGMFIFHYIAVCLFLVPKMFLVSSEKYFELFVLNLFCMTEFLVFFIIPAAMNGVGGWIEVCVVVSYTFSIMVAYVVLIFKANRDINFA